MAKECFKFSTCKSCNHLFKSLYLIIIVKSSSETLSFYNNEKYIYIYIFWKKYIIAERLMHLLCIIILMHFQPIDLGNLQSPNFFQFLNSLLFDGAYKFVILSVSFGFRVGMYQVVSMSFVLRFCWVQSFWKKKRKKKRSFNMISG